MNFNEDINLLLKHILEDIENNTLGNYYLYAWLIKNCSTSF